MNGEKKEKGEEEEGEEEMGEGGEDKGKKEGRKGEKKKRTLNYTKNPIIKYDVTIKLI